MSEKKEQKKQWGLGYLLDLSRMGMDELSEGETRGIWWDRVKLVC